MVDLVGKFGVRFIVAFFTPALAFVALAGATLPPFAGPVLDTFARQESLPLPLAALLLGSAAFIGMVLASLNRTIIRLYEGYFPFPGRSLLRSRESDRRTLVLRARDDLGRAGHAPTQLAAAGFLAHTQFPPASLPVLPTRLGNVIRAAEAYPWARYQIDPITFWSRLLGVIPESYSTKLAETRRLSDFLCSSVLLCQLYGLLAFCSATISENRAALAAAFGAFAVSYALYRAWVAQAIEEGVAFRASFDLYRRDLLQKLGYAAPESLEMEQWLWSSLSLFETYGLPVDHPMTAGHSRPADRDHPATELDVETPAQSAVVADRVRVGDRVVMMSEPAPCTVLSIDPDQKYGEILSMRGIITKVSISALRRVSDGSPAAH